MSKRLKIATQSVRTLIKNERLKAERVGSQWLTSEEDLKEYIEKYTLLLNRMTTKELLTNSLQ